MSIGLTGRQNDCLIFIQGYVAECGKSPSYDEIADGLQLKSKSSVSRLVDALIDRGAVRRLKGKARALEVVGGTGIWVTPLPEVRRAIEAYAAATSTTVKTAIEEALRVYFVEAAGQ